MHLHTKMDNMLWSPYTKYQKVRASDIILIAGKKTNIWKWRWEIKDDDDDFSHGLQGLRGNAIRAIIEDIFAALGPVG